MSPISMALVAGLATWGMTALGASPVFLMKTVNQKLMDGMLGFAAGVMIAASFWSLLLPSMEMSGGSWVPAAVGFALGGLFLYGMDKVLPHLHLGLPMSEAEGIPTRWRRPVLLVSAVTLHNIPEGLALGVAFGALGADLPTATLGGGIALAVGLSIHNFPEGLAVAMPLRREGLGRFKAFFYGQMSGVVEPIAAVAGAALVLSIQPILPYALAFAAGAMIFVVIEELVPESQRHGNADFATVGAMAGFILMMVLDVSLG